MPGSFFNISVLHFLTISVIDRAGSSQLHVIQYMVKIFGGMTCTLYRGSHTMLSITMS